jgi:hypothetical protein
MIAGPRVARVLEVTPAISCKGAVPCLHKG